MELLFACTAVKTAATNAAAIHSHMSSKFGACPRPKEKATPKISVITTNHAVLLISILCLYFLRISCTKADTRPGIKGLAATRYESIFRPTPWLVGGNDFDGDASGAQARDFLGVRGIVGDQRPRGGQDCPVVEGAAADLGAIGKHVDI